MKVLFAARMARWDLLRATQSMSSTESEVVSANHGVRAQGLPSLSLWTFLWKEVCIAKDGKVKSH